MQKYILCISVLLFVLCGIYFLNIFLREKNKQTRIHTPLQPRQTIPIDIVPTENILKSLTQSPTQKSAPSVSIIPTETPKTKILFGIGSQAGDAMHYKIVKESPIKMLTSWYNGSKDLEWMSIQKNDLVPRLYAQKYIVHLITWTDLPEETIQTPHGEACGRPYPVSTQIIDDMKQLAQIYNGNGPMYVTLFTEFQTYTCVDNNWKGNENYFNSLQDNYRKIKDIFHEYAPNSKVALSWGGWQSRYDDKEMQGGLSLFPYFKDVLIESDFTAFQAMESDTNVQEILDMTRILGAYKKPVMLAHYKPSNHSQQVYQNDLTALFTDQQMDKLRQNGLFAISFMDDQLINESNESFTILKQGILKYGKK